MFIVRLSHNPARDVVDCDSGTQIKWKVVQVGASDRTSRLVGTKVPPTADVKLQSRETWTVLSFLHPSHLRL